MARAVQDAMAELPALLATSVRGTMLAAPPGPSPVGSYAGVQGRDTAAAATAAAGTTPCSLRPIRGAAAAAAAAAPPCSHCSQAAARCSNNGSSNGRS
eukprot:9263218-Prorocentrum_lima.AAC.1